MAFENWLKLRAEEIRVEGQKLLNERIKIYGSYLVVASLIVGAVILGINGQVELASALLVSSAIPATIAASHNNKSK